MDPVWSQFRRWSRNGTWAQALTRGGPYGRTKGAKRVVAEDVTGLPVGALVVPASTHENRASELMLEHLTRQGVSGQAHRTDGAAWWRYRRPEASRLPK